MICGLALVSSAVTTSNWNVADSVPLVMTPAGIDFVRDNWASVSTDTSELALAFAEKASDPSTEAWSLTSPFGSIVPLAA